MMKNLSNVGGELQGGKVVACADYNLDFAKSVADKFGIQACASGEEMIQSDAIDAVIVTTADPFHEQYVMAAIMDAITSRGLKLEALNCSGNQLAPNEEGRLHQSVVEKTFKLASLLGVKKIVMMSGCPGGAPGDTTPNWIITS